jgi:electron transport complex protein RnfG
VATLGLTGLLSGLILVGIYLATQPMILRNQAEAMTRAIFRVLPGTTRIETFVSTNGELHRFESPDGSMPTENAVFAGYGEDGSLVGYAVPAAGPGFMDTIKLIYGFDPRRRVVVGMAVLDSRETPGLGDKIIADPQFHANFRELAVEPEIVGVKRGEKTEPNQVDCITGATISSEAVISILNESTHHWLPVLGKQPETARASEGEDDGGGEGS